MEKKEPKAKKKTVKKTPYVPYAVTIRYRDDTKETFNCSKEPYVDGSWTILALKGYKRKYITSSIIVDIDVTSKNL